METIKVSSKSNPNSVAGALANALREKNSIEMQAIGAGALNQAIKAVAIARGFVAPSGKIHYSLYYYTPGLSLGMKGLSIGIALFSSLYIALELIGYDKKFIKESLNLN